MKSIRYLVSVAVLFQEPIHALLQTDSLIGRRSSPLASSPRLPLSSPAGTNKPLGRRLNVYLHSSLAEKSDTTTTKDMEHQSSSRPPLVPKSPFDPEDDMSSKVINFLFLAAAFGYATYTIFSIDSGLTRGWTTGEIAMRIPLDNWGAYEDYLANKPIFTKTLINVIIYLLGDWLSQTAFQKKNLLDFDISRTLRNGFIGLCFGPLVHEYYQFSDTILPPENGMVTRLEKILMDQTIYLTVKCSIYISAVGLLGGDDVQTVKQTVQDKIGGVVLTAWKFWPLVHCITYGLIPARHRILWVNSVDLVWNAILATQAQKDVPEEEIEEIEKQELKEDVELLLEDSHSVFHEDVLESQEPIIPELLPLANMSVANMSESLTNMTASVGFS
eukprot:scaffold22568_cov125-Cylindrotheca_fusiformis.AAC.16